MKDLIIHLLSRPAPKVKVTSDAVARRAATTQARGDERLRLPRRTDDGSAELRAAAARGEVKLTKQYFASYEAQKQERRAARILGWKEERPAAEQEAAAQKLVADLVGPLLALLDEAAGDRYYIGGACTRRASMEDDGKMPSKLGNNEMVRALLAQDAVIRKRSTGAKINVAQVRQLITDGRLIFMRSRTDASPHVCDRAESLAQTTCHATHPSSSTVRMHAAGTVAARGHTEAEGYRIFAWLLRGAAKDPNLSVASIRRREVKASEATRAMQLAAYTPQGPSHSLTLAARETPASVRLQRLTGAASGYMSHVDGPLHTRAWGLLRMPDEWASYTMDFGPGGEAAARASHARIIRAKTSASYAMRRGAYEVLKENVPFASPTSIQTAVEEETEAQVKQHIQFVLGSGSLLVAEEPPDSEAEEVELDGDEEDELE